MHNGVNGIIRIQIVIYLKVPSRIPLYNIPRYISSVNYVMDSRCFQMESRYHKAVARTLHQFGQLSAVEIDFGRDHPSPTRSWRTGRAPGAALNAAQVHVAVGGHDHINIGAVREYSGRARRHGRWWKAYAAVLRKLFAQQDLAAGGTGKIWH